MDAVNNNLNFSEELITVARTEICKGCKVIGENCECAGFLHFIRGIEWKSKQSMSQDEVDMKLTEYINSSELDTKLKLGQYVLVAVSGMAINANSAKTTLSSEFTHNGKRYEAKMMITQKEVKPDKKE